MSQRNQRISSTKVALTPFSKFSYARSPAFTLPVNTAGILASGKRDYGS